MLRTWIGDAVSEIVSLYTMNPSTLYGTINVGPDYKAYDRIDEFSDEQFEEFSLAYKTFATHAYFVLGIKLEPLMNKAIDMGYSDVACSVNKFVPGALVLNVRAITKFPDHP